MLRKSLELQLSVAAAATVVAVIVVATVPVVMPGGWGVVAVSWRALAVDDSVAPFAVAGWGGCAHPWSTVPR